MEYCSDATSTTWECGRAIVLGILSAVTYLLAVVAVYRVIKAHVRRRMYGLNLVMLFMCMIQSNLDWIELLGKRESRIQLMSMTFRSLETNLACSAYATFILENRNAPTTTFWFMVVPLSTLAFAVTLVIFILACLEPVVSCEHPLWLGMGSIQLAVSLTFVVIGLLASKEVNHLLAASAVKSDLMRKRRDLWMLMASFLVASMAQVAGDAWRQGLYQYGNSCRYHEMHPEEVLRTVLFILSFDLPVWSILFVFYYRQRHVFNPNPHRMEIPSVQLLSREELLYATTIHEGDERGIGEDDFESGNNNNSSDDVAIRRSDEEDHPENGYSFSTIHANMTLT